MRIAALYVLYNPNWDYLFKSIDSICARVGAIFFYANSIVDDDKEQKLLSYNDNCRIIGNGTNVGIAKALNELCRAAITDGFDWAVTMDQDSLMPSSFIDEYIDFVKNHDSLKIGIVCPNYKKGDNSVVKSQTNYIEIDKTITSGACMNLKIYQKVNGFKDELFIDSVDTEYSWKVRLAGYCIIRLMWLVLEHHLGQDPYDVSVLGKRILTVDNHNYIRCYYITRNTLFINKEYRKILPQCVKNNKKALKLLIKVLLFENDKIRKTRSIFWGYWDFKRNVLGKYNH